MKLRGKILLSLTTIILVMGVFQSLFFQTRVERIFENYLSDSEQMQIQMMKQAVISYYLQTGSLTGVDQAFNASPKRMMGQMMGNMGTTTEIIILNAVGEEVVNTTKQADQSRRAVKEVLKVNGTQIGTFITYPSKSTFVKRLEQQFVKSVNQTILFGFLFAALLTLLIGFILSKKMTKPLAELMSGIDHVANGDTTFRVAIDSNDEFSHLGVAFNQMSETLERTEHVRKSLVADVAHELRTPLSIIRAKLESIQVGAVEATEEVILQVSDEVYRLSRLVNDLQQLSLAEAGTLPLHKEQTDMNQFLEAIVSQFQWLADEKQITLELRKSADELLLDIDRDRITQVVVNLLGNAIGHTLENGSVTVMVNVKNQFAILAFHDTGSGIAPENIPFIFDRFYRADKSRGRDDGGTGLGLSIAKGFVEVHDGNIDVTSKLGTGTTFKVSLPMSTTHHFNSNEF